MLAAGLYLPSGRTVFPAVAASIIAVATYQANPAENTNTQPATCSQLVLPVQSAGAAIVEPAASGARTAKSPRLSVSAAAAPDHVIAASGMNQNPSAGKAPFGSTSVPAAKSRLSTPKAIQNDPHIPCIAVASPSRAR